MYALIDSNNFFVSCERLFRPDLIGTPTIVLSSNDGCAVARSNEAKALGIKMGEPLHELKRRFHIIDGPTSASRERRLKRSPGEEKDDNKRSDVITFGGASPSSNYGLSDTPHHSAPELVVFSANFQLYGDISRRIASILTHITPRIELYSIDEAFLDLSELVITDYAEWGRALAAKVYREVGVPVSVGIAPTKTLCKLAADYAKHHPESHGAYFVWTGGPNEPVRSTGASEKRAGECGLSASEATLAPEESEDSQRLSARRSAGQAVLASAQSRGRETWQASLQEWEALLVATPIQNIWGIGYRLAPKLKAEGIHTALDLAQLRPQRAQQLMGIHGRRMVAELCGISCIPLQSAHKPQQVVSRGRQFGHDTSDFNVIEAAIASMATSATAALRREGQLATRASVRITTHRLKPNYQAISRDVHLYTPTANTGTIASQLARLMQHDFDKALSYHKVEVTLWDLVPDTQLQTDVFGTVNSHAHTRSATLMRTLDALNNKHGNGTLRYAAEDLSHAWHPRKTLSSPAYTTNWQQLPSATTD